MFRGRLVTPSVTKKMSFRGEFGLAWQKWWEAWEKISQVFEKYPNQNLPKYLHQISI
jgi:hypothetical protein